MGERFLRCFQTRQWTPGLSEDRKPQGRVSDKVALRGTREQRRGCSEWKEERVENRTLLASGRN